MVFLILFHGFVDNEKSRFSPDFCVIGKSASSISLSISFFYEGKDSLYFLFRTFSTFSTISSGEIFFIQAKSPRMQGLLP